MKQHQTSNNTVSNSEAPLLGVSACLLGNQVRFDGGHKKNEFILNSLSTYMRFQSICPEIEAGFGLPRAAMQLRLVDKDIRLVLSKTVDADVSEKMQRYANDRMASLADLDGFIFKKDSPSCGVFRVPVVVNKTGYREKRGQGLFAETFIQTYPLIPVEEEGRLNDVALRENFFERVYAYHRWKLINDAENNVQGLIDFHARHKLLLMARGSHFYTELGRMVAGTTRKNLSQRREAYIQRFMHVMKEVSPHGRQVNVLQHIMGYLKNDLSHEDKKELLSIFEAYRLRQLPLITAVTLLRHYFRLYPQPYIAEQHYLAPFPEQLALRSYI